MKRIILSLFVLATASMNVACKGEKNETGEVGEVATASTESITYVVNNESSVIEWTGSKPAGKHNGTINLKSGELAVTNEAIESGMFVIDMNLIETPFLFQINQEIKKSLIAFSKSKFHRRIILGLSTNLHKIKIPF